ncbi:MAG: CsbD family protein [Proteobacteria bacterium]|nr:CsbD family protein [Pseudomonadota bacterium]
MQTDVIRRHWARLKSPIRAQWSKLTRADLAREQGSRRYLISRLQERYGWRRDKAELECRMFLHTLKGILRGGHAV